MPFKYQSGETIMKGDRIMFHGEPGEIEFVVDSLTGEPAQDWFMNEYGGGVMVIEPKCFGNVFLDETENEEDMVFVSRKSTSDEA
jgi:hypothetical protein